jgi:hypothetical protein
MTTCPAAAQRFETLGTGTWLTPVADRRDAIARVTAPTIDRLKRTSELEWRRAGR